MTHRGPHFSDVIFDARTARFIANAVIPGAKPKVLPVAAAGHISWSHDRITAALRKRLGRNTGARS